MQFECKSDPGRDTQPARRSSAWDASEPRVFTVTLAS
jgi:hypothetical protein